MRTLQSRHLFLILATAALTQAACTKERPFKVLLKEETESKRLVDVGAEYLYVPSLGSAPRKGESARPFWEGDPKIVKMDFTEKSLRVRELESDGRFTDNQLNNKPVLEIPVEHLAFECKKNSFDECGNEEAKKEDITWDKKDFFKPDFSKLEHVEVPTLPVELNNFFIPLRCNEEVAKRVVGYKLEQDAITLELERDFKISALCANRIESLSDLSFTLRYVYSFVKLSTLASPGYQAIAYPRKDEGTFGFFNTEQTKLSIDHRDEKDGEISFLNRWNPERGKITYYLSDAFAKPENGGLRRAAQISVNAINEGFRKAGVGLSIELKAAEGRNPGDIRNSMIVLVEDPSDAGLLGYGPSVTNPKTGEILRAITIMYPGTMIKFIRRAYEEILAERKLDSENQPPAAPGTGGAPTGLTAAVDKILATGLHKLEAERGKIDADPHHDFHLHETTRGGDTGVGFVPVDRVIREEVLHKAESRLPLSELRAQLTSCQAALDDSAPATGTEEHNPLILARCSSLRSMLLDRQSIRTADSFNFEDAVSTGMKRELKLKEYKPWKELSAADQKHVIEALLPYVFVPTLIHELGHNVGLRHNFAGSEDKANFYSLEEIKKEGLSEKDVDQPKYASIMDYGYRNLNELRILGKYDVAAIRFGYKRQVEAAEKVDGRPKYIDVPTTLKEMPEAQVEALREFQFCTDEHVGINAGCKRFDEGTNFKEIAQYLAETYESRYKEINLRDGRRNFSLMDDGNYLARMSDTFLSMRTFFEVYDRVAKRIGAGNAQWKTNPFLIDLKEAADISLAFLVNVIKTPDVHCAIAQAKEPRKIVEMVPIAVTGAETCTELSDVATRNGLVIVGSVGKRLNSFKLRSNDNPYVDQIDVRGIWGDKVLAMKMLFDRQLGIGTFDSTTGNYFDSFPGAAPVLVTLLQEFLTDNVTTEALLTTPDGDLAVLPTEHKPFENHHIAKPLSKRLTQLVGLDDAAFTPFLKPLLKEVTSQSLDFVNSPLNRNLSDLLTVREFNASLFTEGKDVQTRIGSRRYMAAAEHKVARLLFQNLEITRLLEKIDQKRLAEILKYLQSQKKPGDEEVEVDAGALSALVHAEDAPKPEPSATPSPAPSVTPPPAVDPGAPKNELEKFVAEKLGPELIEEFLTGKLNKSAYWENVIDLLVRAQSP